MSVEAVKWAMDDAPMLLTDKGKADTTARHVLQALAEHAHADGAGACPSLLRLRYRTGFDRRTVQRALRRLEVAGLIKATGTEKGRTVWRIDLLANRPQSDWAALEAEDAAEREAAAERQRRSRAERVTHTDDVAVTQSDDVTARPVMDAGRVTSGSVTDSAYARHGLEVRDVTHSASARHALNAAQTINEPPENQYPDGRRPGTGSGDEGVGGFAASDKPGADRIPPGAISGVIAALPGALTRRLPDLVPGAIVDAVSAEFRRGVDRDVIVARIARRWRAHGYELDTDTEGRGAGLRHPVGVAIALVRRGACTSPRCDDGCDLDTGEACRTCEREAEDRSKAAAAPLQGTFFTAVPGTAATLPPGRPATAPAQPMRTCRGCERPSRSLPDDGICIDCRADGMAVGGGA
ncbi:helix-turn-helix domain-containing protein [Actinacidiphila glaucinigra]|uniref:helix-turn-helix domain-containing protein n=1 Tax=Actinacidiphila glaucinigra TaxID=235986 RepID=UPI00369D23A2